MVKRFLNMEVNINTKDANERTALSLAAEKSHLDVVKALTQKPATTQVMVH